MKLIIDLTVWKPTLGWPIILTIAINHLSDD